MMKWIIACAALLVSGPAFSESLSIIASRDLSGDVHRVLGAGEVAGSLKRSGSPVLLIDLGGALSPSEQAFEHRREGSLTVSVMNRAHYSAAFVGSTDLAWASQFGQFYRRTNFPVLAANLHRADSGRHLFQVQPYTVIRVASKRIGLVGLSHGASELLAANHLEAARYYSHLISGRVDILVVVSDADPQTNADIAGLEEVDLVIASENPGHVSPEAGGLVVCAGPGSGVWGIDITLENSVVISAVCNEMQVPSPDAGVVTDAFLGWTADVEGEPVSLGTVLGLSEGGFRRTLTSPLGYLAADLMRAAEETDVALVRTTHFPDDLVTGEITVYDLYRAYPLPFTVTVANTKGEELLKLLDLVDGEMVYYPSGIQVVYSDGEAGGRLAEAKLGGKAIDPRIDYTVALEHGASGEVQGKVIRNTGLKVRDLFARHLRTSQSVKGMVDGRIQRR